MKYIFVPISTLGCGKSTIFRILKRIYPEWAHVENDDCKSKRDFLARISKELSTHNVVLLDRNNHQKLHREQIIDSFKKPEVVLVALEFVDATLDQDRLRNTTFKRVDLRGDNHQNIAGSSQKGLTRSIMNRFFKEFTPLEDSGCDAQFDHRLKMDLGLDSSLTNAKRILQFMVDVTEIPDLPSDTLLREEYQRSLAYKAQPNPRETKARKQTDKGQRRITQFTKSVPEKGQGQGKK